MTTPEPSDQYVQSLVRGLSVIRAFDADHATMTLSEIAAQTDLTRATARRFLLTLVEIGYVRTDGRTFELTPRVLELGFSYLSALSLPELAQPHLEAFSRETGESSSMSVLDGSEIVYVARAAVRRIMSVSISVGTRFTAYTTSMGRVLLAATDAALPEVLEHPTPRSLATVADLRAELARVREQGFSLVDQELEIGLRSLAVAITDAAGSTVAAINVSVAAGAHSLDELTDELLPRLRTTAARVEAELRR
ncbi:IclR family transcriptional regulator C-terminal domain-containing protein [soil metagenome]